MNPAEERKIGRYRVLGEIASGGMATVSLGRLEGPVGFARLVAIKSLHAQYAKDPDFLSMFLDEARLASRVRHPNVAPILDVLSQRGELHLVMEYVEGESLSRLMRSLRQHGGRVPVGVCVAVMIQVLDGLHAAHEATDDQGDPLGIVHRDVSPQNILVARDGSARIVDFGIAKAVGRMQTTRGDQLKGKIAYMAPEQLSRDPLDRRADVYAAGIVLWELLADRRLFYAEDEISTFKLATEAKVDAPSAHADVPAVLDEIVLCALRRDRSDRYASARELAMALEATGLAASAREVAAWMLAVAGQSLSERAELLASTEAAPATPEEIATDSGLSLPTALAGRLAQHDAATAILQQPSRPVSPRPERLGRRPLWLLSGALLSALLALPLVWWLSRGTAPAVAASVPSATAAAALEPAPPSLSNVSAAEPAVEPAREPAKSPKPRSAPARPRARKVDCQNPFTVDAQGVRVPKLECL